MLLNGTSTINKVTYLCILGYLLQGITLGGTGKETGDRHPKIGHGALIGAGATVLGNIAVGEGAMVASGSLVLKDIPPHRLVTVNLKSLDENILLSLVIHLFQTSLCFPCFNEQK